MRGGVHGARGGARNVLSINNGRLYPASSVASPYEEMIMEMLEEKKRRLQDLQTYRAHGKEVCRLQDDITTLEERLKAYQKGLEHFRRRAHPPAQSAS